MSFSNDDLRMQDFADSAYHRPQDPTVSIPAGVVKPYPVREDGSWDLDEEEPTLTRPSLRRRRTVLTLAVIAFTIGSLLMILSSPYSNEFLAPGPLHSSHAQLLAGQGADRCAACHSGSTSSTFGWVAHAFSGASNKITQSQLCLECHKTSLGEAWALNPHNVAPEKLAKTTAKFQNASFASKMSLPPVSHDSEIACSACHREHKGSNDLKAMTDAQCQSCHQSSFSSFESGHPEFTNWPNSSKQNIAFDHSTHMSKHFAASGQSFDCNQCHLDDSWQNVKVLAPFEQACASCHEQKVIDSSVDGFALLSLPMLDMSAIERQNLQVGNWPLAATGDFDGPLPAAMRMLLMVDPDAGPILKTKPVSFEFADLDPGNARDVRDAVTLAWSIKRLLHELSLKGSPAMQRRLEIALDRKLDDNHVAGMFSGLDNHSFASAARRWFPGLGTEIKTKYGGVIELGTTTLIRDQGYLAQVRTQDQLATNPLVASPLNEASNQIEVSSQIESEPIISRPALPQSDQQPVLVLSERPVATVKRDVVGESRAGWIRDDRTPRIFYRPHGHSDKFLQHWIDAVLKTPDADSHAATAGLFKSLTEVSSIGNCRYCHTLKRNADRSLVMHWMEDRRDGSAGQFTSFSHRPHLVQPALQDCSHCHRLDATVSNRESFASLDRVGYHSNFHAIEKSNCTSCHQKGLTSNSCSTCHDYHVGAHWGQGQ